MKTMIYCLMTTVPAKVAYKLARLTDTVRAETKHFHEQRTALLREMGNERPATPEEAARLGPAVVEVPAEKLAAFSQRLRDVADVEVTLSDRWLLTLEDLSAFTLSGDDVLALGGLVIDAE